MNINVISLIKMRESNYWLRIIKAAVFENKDSENLDILLDESEQLKKILGSIVTKTRGTIVKR